MIYPLPGLAKQTLIQFNDETNQWRITTAMNNLLNYRGVCAHIVECIWACVYSQELNKAEAVKGALDCASITIISSGLAQTRGNVGLLQGVFDELEKIIRS